MREKKLLSEEQISTCPRSKGDDRHRWPIKGAAMIWLELLVVLVCIFVGARLGGIALGTVAGIGLVVLVFIFGLPPGMPPRTVLGMILAVITAAATMQAAGGLDYLVVIADRTLRVWPAGITLVAPVIAYVFTLAAGTGHIIYALLPVIAEVSRKAGVRPERPLSIATIASQQAITASPISAATVALLGLVAPAGIHLTEHSADLHPVDIAGQFARRTRSHVEGAGTQGRSYI